MNGQRVADLGDDVDLIPWRSAQTVLFVTDGKEFRQGWNIGEKQELLTYAGPGDSVYVVWPGQYSSHIRVVDDVERAYLCTLTDRQRAAATS